MFLCLILIFSVSLGKTGPGVSLEESGVRVAWTGPIENGEGPHCIEGITNSKVVGRLTINGKVFDGDSTEIEGYERVDPKTYEGECDGILMLGGSMWIPKK